jgi:ribonuclease HI
MDYPEKLVIFFDGSTEPVNPRGVSTYGFTISDGEKILHRGSGVAAEMGDPKSTNNFAEYCALGFALKHLQEKEWCGELDIFGDSQLVIYQLTEKWACNKEHLQKLRERIWKLVGEVSTVCRYGWVPREKNKVCDALSREAYEKHTGKKYPERRK